MIKLCRARYNLEVQEISLTIDQRQWCEEQFATLLQAPPTVTPLKVEASHRLFFRIEDGRDAYVLMLSPPALEQNEQFVTMQMVFNQHNVPVPDLLAYDYPLGLFLMSDLGKDDFETIYETEDRDLAISSAIDCLHIIQSVNQAPPYTAERFQLELEIFQEWFIAKTLSLDNLDISSSTGPLLEAIDAQPIGCVHRDYHCRNLLFNRNQLGIVDFQDALVGPALYDLASLLRDCYYIFEEKEIDHWLNYYLGTETPVTDALRSFTEPQIRRMLDFTAIQRQLKAIGIFARLNIRDQKSSHLRYIEPLLGRLISLSSTYDELRPLKMQLDSCSEQFSIELSIEL